MSQKTKTYLYWAAIIVLSAIMLLSIYKIYQGYSVYRDEANVKSQMSVYSPNFSNSEISTDPLAEAQKINSDICAWIKIDDTNIDYPIVQSNDNNYYLRRNIYKKYARAGTIFLDYRCSKLFEDFNTIIYGHNLKNGSMFSELTKYKKSEFFNQHDTFNIATDNEYLVLKAYAYLVVNDDSKIYSLADTDSQRESYIKYINENATVLNEQIEIDSESQIVILSTCTNVTDEQRAVLVAKII
jgi:sortase, srtB family